MQLVRMAGVCSALHIPASSASYGSAVVSYFILDHLGISTPSIVWTFCALGYRCPVFSISHHQRCLLLFFVPRSDVGLRDPPSRGEKACRMAKTRLFVWL
ncbi:hypothetical protein EXIGLDRAFT_235192 [Exidia glandulosa HHB12029]|uniref:Uncharacterized protein n=1 Tax=Exidia glandulosa HHB12029 TaxID=1314781 RepID=A0A165ZVE8_EXIGL|nr:hypothetical protein EXIGLDRAFT_235192 [Exidia glandulosa HHB12029]